MNAERDQYIVTKHYGAGMAHIHGTTHLLEDAVALAERHSKAKGKFKGRAVVRVWKLEKEVEVKV